MDMSKRLNSFLSCSWQAVHATLPPFLLLCAHLPWWCSLHWISNHLCLFQWTVVLLLGSFQILTQWVNAFVFYLCPLQSLSLQLWIGIRCNLFPKCVLLDLVLITLIAVSWKIILLPWELVQTIASIFILQIFPQVTFHLWPWAILIAFSGLGTHIISGMLFTCSGTQFRDTKPRWFFPTTRKKERVCFDYLDTLLFGTYFRSYRNRIFIGKLLWVTWMWLYYFKKTHFKIYVLIICVILWHSF